MGIGTAAVTAEKSKEILDELVKLNVSDAFREMFLVVIQLGAILAVVVLYFKKLWPFSTKEKFFIKKDTFGMWFKMHPGSHRGRLL